MVKSRRSGPPSSSIFFRDFGGEKSRRGREADGGGLGFLQAQVPVTETQSGARIPAKFKIAGEPAARLGHGGGQVGGEPGGVDADDFRADGGGRAGEVEREWREGERAAQAVGAE